MTNPFGGSYAPGAPFGSNQLNPAQLENPFEANKMPSGNVFGTSTAMSTGNTAFGGTTFGNPKSSTSTFGSSTFGSFGTQSAMSNLSGSDVATTASTFGNSQFGQFATQQTTGSNVTAMAAPMSLFGTSTFGDQTTNVTRLPGEFSTGEFPKASTGTVFGNKQAAPKMQSAFGGSSVFGNTPAVSSHQNSSNLFIKPGPVTQSESTFPINTSSNARTSTTSVFGGFVGDKKKSLFGKSSQGDKSMFGKSEQDQVSVTLPMKKSNVAKESDWLVMDQVPPASNLFRSQGEKSMFGKSDQDQVSVTLPMKKSNVAKESDWLVMDNVTPSSNLFQKAPTSTSLFGKKASTSFDIEPVEKTLFGKPVLDIPDDKADSTRRIKRSDMASRLGGRDTTTSRLRGRETATSRVGGRDTTTSRPGGRETMISRVGGRDTTTSRQGRQDTRASTSSKKDDHDATAKSIGLKRLSSTSEEITTKIAIVCKNINSRVNNAVLLRRHFSKFGEVAKIFSNPAKGSAVVHFKDHEGALNAKRNGRVMQPGMPQLQIFWSAHSPMSKQLSREQVAAKTRLAGDKKTSRARSLWEEEDVSDELSIMTGTQDISGEIAHSVDQPPEFISSHSPERSKLRQFSPSRQAMKTEQVASSSPKGPANTSAERFQVLDTRDKLYRQGKTKQTRLSMAKAFVGTCHDMCPEKERYEREDKRRLHAYELVQGSEHVFGQNPKVDHTRAVKEYSRSSADQEEPLPHELRSGPVLAMTMNYLLSEIADRGSDGKWEDWFDFLWNRTRGIRKDITQQSLCDRTAVELIEKCTRFHIFCSERLCEEDVSVFDEKINNENLTKCLQTLKELYHDLDHKYKSLCNTESEFRAYMVLMNLNEGDTLREVQQLRPDVRNSKEINFAIQVYAALNSNNYVKFFRLVREGSFLNACVMHRYFNQIRRHALQTMLKAYVAGSKPVAFPLGDLIRILALESKDEASDFCQHYGLKVNGDDVVLERAAFFVPEVAYPACRAASLIEFKRMVSVGEVINGENLSPLHTYVPSSSFDAAGKFTTTDGVPVSTKFDVEPLKEKSAMPMGVVSHSNEDVKFIAKELFLEVIDEFVQNMSYGLITTTRMFIETATKLYDDIVQVTTTDMIRDLCNEAYDHEVLARQELEEAEIQAHLEREDAQRRDQLEREAAERKAQQIREAVEAKNRRDRLAAEILESVMEEVVHKSSQQMVDAQIREVSAELQRQRVERCTLSVNEALLHEVIEEISVIVSERVYQSDVVDRIRILEQCEQCVKLQRTARYFQTWKRVHASRVRLKRSMLAFPCAPSSDNYSDQLKSFLPSRDIHNITDGNMYLDKHAKISLDSPMSVERNRDELTRTFIAREKFMNLRRQRAWAPLDLTTLLGPQIQTFCTRLRPLMSHSRPSVHWKLLVSLPEANSNETTEQQSSTRLAEWVTMKLRKGSIPACEYSGTNSKTSLLSLYTLNVDGGGFKVCIRSITGTLSEEDVDQIEEENLCLGSSGVLFVLDIPDSSEDLEDYWLKAQLRLARQLQAKPISPGLPLVVLLPTRTNQKDFRMDLSANLNLSEYLVQDLISAVHIMEVDASSNKLLYVDVENPQLTTQLGESLQWLVQHLPPQPDLKMRHIRDYLEDGIAQEFYTPVLQNLYHRKKSGCLHQGPDVLLSLYNHVITHLASLACSQSLRLHSWPITEFTWMDSNSAPVYWNSVGHLDYIEDVITSLQLPWFEFNDVTTEDWSEVCSDVWNYVKSVAVSESTTARVDFCSRIRALLRNVQADFEGRCLLLFEDEACQPTPLNIPWTDVILACINYRLQSTDFTDPNSTDNEEIRLFYDPSALKLTLPAAWLQSLGDRTLNDAKTLTATMRHAVDKKRQLASDSSGLEEDDLDSVPISKKKCDAKYADQHLTKQQRRVDADNPEEQTVKFNKRKGEREVTDGEHEVKKTFDLLYDEQQTVDMSSSDSSLFINELKASLRKEKAENYKFEEYMESMLMQGEISCPSGEDEQSYLPSFDETDLSLNVRHAEFDYVPCNPLLKSYNKLVQGLKTARKEDELYEQRLQKLINQ